MEENNVRTYSRAGLIYKYKKKTPILKSIKTYKSKIPERLAYIPVLDDRPDLAADYLTINDMKSSYELLKIVFDEIKQGKGGTHKILYDTIMFNKQNFDWFCIFFKQLESNLIIENTYEIPYLFCPLGEEDLLDKEEPFTLNLKNKFNKKKPIIHQPFGVYYKKEVYSLDYLPSNKSDVDFVTNYRIKYILESYGLEDFKNSTFPSWYSLSETTIYEKYSYKTNARVRIDFKDNTLHYFIAGASDNWREIEDVPEDMNYIVYALLYKNYLVDDGKPID